MECENMEFISTIDKYLFIDLMNYLHGLSIFRQPNCVDETDTKVTKRVSNLEKVAVIYISVYAFMMLYMMHHHQ